MTNIPKICIEDHDNNKELKCVVIYHETDQGRLRWWSVFDGTQEECNYFKDNLSKGLNYLYEKEDL